MKATHHDSSSVKASEAKECSFFASTGNCKFGDQCKFRHIQSDPQPTAVAAATTTTAVRPHSQQLTDHPTVPCSSFVQKGFCKFGDSCKFIHDVRYAKQPATTTTAAVAEAEVGVGTGASTGTTHRRVNRVNKLNPAQKRPRVTDESERCPDRFSSMDERGQPNGTCTNQSCPFRHYMSSKEYAEWLFATFGWAPVHSATFYGSYKPLAELLSESENPQALINLPTAKPYVIEWSEHDPVDRCSDYYKITIPAGSTAMDIVRTTSANLDRDSRNLSSVVEYLADSSKGRWDRQICLKILQNPTTAKEIMLNDFK